MKAKLGKIISVILALTLSAALLLTAAGCTPTEPEGKTAAGDKTQTAAPTESVSKPTESAIPDDNGLKPEPGAKLKVWDSEGNEGDWLKKVIKDFTQLYGVEVTYEPVTHTDSPTKLKTDGPAGLGADVFSAPHDKVGDMVSSGLIYPNDVLNPDEFLDASVQGTSYDGVWYGYPDAIETYALFYNKDLIAEPPETFDELIEFSKEFTDISKNQYGFMMEVANFYYIYSFIGGYGGYVFGNNGSDSSDIGLNSSGAVEGMKFHQSLKEILPLNTADINYDIKNSLFNEGKLALNIDGPWAVLGHKDAGVNFGVAPLPVLPNGKHPTSFSGIRAFYVNSYTKYPNAAKLLAKYLTSSDLLADRFESTSQIPPRKDLLQSPSIKGDPISAAFLEQAQYAQAMPNIPEMASVWVPMATALDENWNTGGDPKAILDSAVNSIKEALALQGN